MNSKGETIILDPAFRKLGALNTLLKITDSLDRLAFGSKLEVPHQVKPVPGAIRLDDLSRALRKIDDPTARMQAVEAITALDLVEDSKMEDTTTTQPSPDMVPLDSLLLYMRGRPLEEQDAFEEAMKNGRIVVKRDSNRRSSRNGWGT